MPQLEIVEGPGAGRVVEVRDPVIVGREPGVDVVLDDGQVSRRHARISSSGQGIVVEDLQSSNGTFVNGMEVHGHTAISPGDELLIGTSVFQWLAPAATHGGGGQVSGVRAVPPALAKPAGRPDFVDRVKADAPAAASIPELERLKDTRVRAQAKLAPLAIFAIAALLVVIYLGTN